MPISSLASLKTHKGLPPTVSTQDLILQQMLDAAETAVESYCGRKFSAETYTEYLSGNGMRDLTLKQRPVRNVVGLWLDSGGYFGDGTDAFDSTTLLTAGTDYALIRDQGNLSKSGRVRRIGSSVTTGGEFGWYPSHHVATSPLAARKAAGWPVGTGNLKVTYVAGYVFDDMPADLRHAVNQLATYLDLVRKRGGLLPQSESLGNYSYTNALIPLTSTPELGSTRQLLSTYREVKI